MTRLLLLLASVALVGAAPAPRDWRTNAVESPAGWTFGKPGAPLLVEYGSLGCPHCAHFAAETGSRIDGLVKAGKLEITTRTSTTESAHLGKSEGTALAMGFDLGWIYLLDPADGQTIAYAAGSRSSAKKG